MSKGKGLLIGQAVVLALLVQIPAAHGHDNNYCYTVASVQGSWAVVTTFGSNFAKALGTRTVEENGAFTGTLKKVWNNGKFAGGYRKFRDKIVSLMPSSQTPNYYFVGAAVPLFA